MFAFSLVDQFTGARMGVDLHRLAPGRVAVVECPRRLSCEQSYGFIHALWWVWLADGRSAVSIPPGAAQAVRPTVAGITDGGALLDPGLAERLRPAVDDALREAGRASTDRMLVDLCFACNASLLRMHDHGDCRRLVDESISGAEGLQLPRHCFPDGIAYGVVAGGQVASVAYAHRTGTMEDQVADLGVVTAPGYRRHGHAKTAVSAVVAHIVRAGGEARYGCRPDNLASIATARSVGFVPYGTSLVLAAPA